MTVKLQEDELENSKGLSKKLQEEIKLKEYKIESLNERVYGLHQEITLKERRIEDLNGQVYELMEDAKDKGTKIVDLSKELHEKLAKMEYMTAEVTHLSECLDKWTESLRDQTAVADSFLHRLSIERTKNTSLTTSLSEEKEQHSLLQMNVFRLIKKRRDIKE